MCVPIRIWFKDEIGGGMVNKINFSIVLKMYIYCILICRRTLYMFIVNTIYLENSMSNNIVKSTGCLDLLHQPFGMSRFT